MLTKRKRPRLLGKQRLNVRRMQDGGPVIVYRLWRTTQEVSRGGLRERKQLEGGARSRRRRELRWRRCKHRKSTGRSSIRLRRGHMEERDHHDSDRQRLDKTGEQRQLRQVRRVNDTAGWTTHHGGCGLLLGRRRRTIPCRPVKFGNFAPNYIGKWGSGNGG